jgi:hypothetical protein
MGNEKTCPMSTPCAFCWRNPRHWYFLVATLPFFVAGVRFVADLVGNVVPAAQ